jgi:TPR repeat protein
MNNLGICCEEGNGVPQDYNMATKLYKQSSDLGNISAINNLGYMYLMQKDNEKAASLFRIAADKGRYLYSQLHYLLINC